MYVVEISHLLLLGEQLETIAGDLQAGAEAREREEEEQHWDMKGGMRFDRAGAVPYYSQS